MLSKKYAIHAEAESNIFKLKFLIVSKKYAIHFKCLALDFDLDFMTTTKKSYWRAYTLFTIQSHYLFSSHQIL